MTTDAGDDTSAAPARTPATSARSSAFGRTGGLLRRLVKGTAVTVVVLVLAFFLGGGWYFAGQIYADGLRIEHRVPTPDLEVTAVGPHSLTIADPAGQVPTLDGDDAYGLTWAGGYGQIAGPGQGGEEVTHDFRLLAGEAPRAGTRVALDRRAFPPKPADVLDHPVRPVRVAAPLGRLPAWHAPGHSRTWAVLVHGKGGDRAEMLRLMRSTVAVGMPSLAVTYRNDEGTTIDASEKYQYGRTEWRDLTAYVDWARRHGARKVVLVGASMGGGIIASYLRQTPGAPVAGVVLDAPMLDLGATVSYGAERRVLPLLGHVPAPLTYVAKQLAAVRYDLDWTQVDYLEDPSWLKVPTLVLHGGADETVPLATSEDLARARPELVRLERFAGASHVGSWNSDPQRYDAAVRRFLRHL